VEPPAGRIQIGDRVEVPGGQQGDVVTEALIPTNGAWRYVVRLQDGSTREHFDVELRRLP
jgi:hypothetical protein